MKKKSAFIFFIQLTIFIVSCRTSDKNHAANIEEVVIEAPKTETEEKSNKMFFTGGGIKIMYSDLEWTENSSQFSIEIPSGQYELMACVKAVKYENANLDITIDDKIYKLYTSNPPLGLWELTVRSPITINLEADKTVNFKIKLPDQIASDSLKLNYIQIVKLDQE